MSARGSVAIVRLAVLALLVASAGAALAVPAAPAAAHARYERSEPADGAVVAESPAQVDVYFSQDMARSGGLPMMVVTNDAGDVVSEEPVLDDGDRRHLYAELAPALPPGRYTVIWHNLSDEDGEEAQGAFHFYVGEGPSDATPSQGETPRPTVEPTVVTPLAETPTPAPSPAPADGDNGDDGGVPPWALVLGIAVGVVAGGGAGLLVGRRLAG